MNPLPLFQMSLNASQDHFSIGNVAKLKCDMGYVVNDQVNEKQKNWWKCFIWKTKFIFAYFLMAFFLTNNYGIGLTMRFGGENYC